MERWNMQEANIRLNIDVLRVNIYYLTTMIIVYVIGGRFQRKGLYSGLLVTEYVLLLIPSFIFLVMRKARPRKYLLLRKISKKELVYSIVISLLLYPVILIINTFFISGISKMIGRNPRNTPIPKDMIDLVKSIFVMGITPGICEELMFRGIIIREYERVYGLIKSIFMVAFLFALFHLNIYNFIGPMVLGVVLGIVREKSESIYPAMIIHAMNNIIALVLSYILNKRKFFGFIDHMGNKITSKKMIFLYVCIIFIFLTVIGLIIKKLPNRKKKDLIVGGSKVKISSRMPIIIGVIIFFYANWKLYL